MTLTTKLDRNWSSFQLANSTPPQSVTGNALAPSARICRRGMKTTTTQRSLISNIAVARTMGCGVVGGLWERGKHGGEGEVSPAARPWPREPRRRHTSAATPVSVRPRGRTSMLLRRVGCAAVGAVSDQRNASGARSRRSGAAIALEKSGVIHQSSVEDLSVITLIRTDTTLDHSQKAEKV